MIAVWQEGQGPVTPAREAGTSSWIPQAGQWKRILSEFIPKESLKGFSGLAPVGQPESVFLVVSEARIKPRCRQLLPFGKNKWHVWCDNNLHPFVQLPVIKRLGRNLCGW